MPATQKFLAEKFLSYHTGNEILVLPNAWDAGSARLVAAAGARAIATTSMGVAASLGYPDGQAIPVAEMAEAIRRIVDAVSIPVTADIEAGYGKDLKEILTCVEMLVRTGIVGGNVEDSYNRSPDLVDADAFCERIAAIRALTDSLGFHFVINTRTDVFLNKSGDPSTRLAEAVRRGNKYRAAGADSIFIPDVWEEENIRVLVNEIDAPINILVNTTNGTGLPPSVEKLQALGVARVSFGSSIMKATLALTKKIVEEVITKGTYDVLAGSLEPIPDTLKAYQMATTS